MELLKTGAYLVNGTEIIEDTPEAQARLQAVAGPDAPSKEEAAGRHMAVRRTVLCGLCGAGSGVPVLARADDAYTL